jgi:hypothetical protein
VNIPEGGFAGGLAGILSLVALGSKGLGRQTNNRAGSLGGLSGTSLADLLNDTLLVHATVDLSPVNLARILLVKELGLRLAIEQVERLQNSAKQVHNQ